MDERIKTVIFITEYPFNQRDYNRFGIELLRTKKLKVEIWDITSCLHKEFKDQLITENIQQFENLRFFNTKNEIIQAVSSLDNRCIINCVTEFSLRTFFLFRSFLKYNIPYCVFGMASFPNPYPVQKTLPGRIISLFRYIRLAGIREICESVVNRILLKHYTIFGIAPASVIFCGGEKSQGLVAYPENGKTTRLWAHMLDYDIFLQDPRGNSNLSKKTGVFLDEYLPFHPDFLYQGVEFPILPDVYYPKICSFFLTIEKNTGSEIIVAAHPKSDYKNLPDYFSGRKVIKGKTDFLVRGSSFVVAHMSTSLNFAVLYHKPLIFITTDELQTMISGKNLNGLYIPQIAKELGKKPINVDHIQEIDWINEMKVNDEAYHVYINNYIKKKGTPEKPFWEIFYDFIKQNSDFQ